jgi:hypothetical protein
VGVGDPVSAGDRLARAVSRLCDRDDVEPVAERSELGQVRDLRDQPAADDSQSKSHGQRLDHSLSNPVKGRFCPSISETCWKGPVFAVADLAD